MLTQHKQDDAVWKESQRLFVRMVGSQEVSSAAFMACLSSVAADLWQLPLTLVVTLALAGVDACESMVSSSHPIGSTKGTAGHCISWED